MMALTAGTAGLAGLATGIAIGYAVSRARLCSFGAIEDALIGRDWRRMKIFALALAVALAATQTFILLGLLSASDTSLAPNVVPWLAAAIGSVAFGLGMALVGTCAFGCLVRLGRGDLRSLVVLGIFSIVAYATLRGVLSPLRIDWVEPVSVHVPGDVPAALPEILSWLAMADMRLPVTVIVVGVLLSWVGRDQRLRKARRLLTAGIVLGAGVAAGWVVTGMLADPFEGPIRAQSLTFVAPVARGLFGLAAGEAGFVDFGVASVAGVVIGAAVHARLADEIRWEAFDDHHEMKRHLLGAVLMGFGGILAGGCTIGQGLTAGSLMALSWPITVAGMFLGARVGIAILVGGSVLDVLPRPSRWLRPRGTPAE